MSLLEDNPAPRDDYESEQALLWHDATHLFLYRNIATTAFMKTGLFAMVSGLRGDTRNDPVVNVTSFVNANGEQLNINYWVAGYSIVIPMANGRVKFRPDSEASPASRFNVCKNVRSVLACTAFSPEASAAEMARYLPAKGIPDKCEYSGLYADIIFSEDPRLNNWRTYYLANWPATQAKPQEQE